jgi:hypothetical protein
MSDKEKKREYDKRYYEKHRSERIAKTKAYFKKYVKEHRIYQNQYNKKRMNELYSLIGNTCFICGSKEHICFHEKHGLNHEKYHGSCGYPYYLQHHEDFIPLCYQCHKLVHGLKRNVDKVKLEYVVSLLP